MICKTLKEIILRGWGDDAVVKCFTLQAGGPEFKSPVLIQKAGHSSTCLLPVLRDGGGRRSLDSLDFPVKLVSETMSQKNVVKRDGKMLSHDL